MLKSNRIVHVMLDQNSATRGQQSYKFMEIWGREAMRSISPSSHTTNTLLFKEKRHRFVVPLIYAFVGFLYVS